jgi:predicted NBD/HSP70 family sugar kinase
LMRAMRANQLAIGIQIVGGSKDFDHHLVGVVANRFAEAASEPMTERLPRVSRGDVIDTIAKLVRRLGREPGPGQEIVTVGVEIAGLLHDGVVLHAPPLGPDWAHVPLKAELSQRLDKVVVLVNDANALAVYERDTAQPLGPTDRAHFVVTLLTELGIGCGMVIGGQVYNGYRGGSGELGHIEVVDGKDAESCRCGRKGCLQTVSTVSAMAEALREVGYPTFEAALRDADTAVVSTVLSTGGAALGRALSMLVNLINPSTVVIYGQEAILGETRRFPLVGAAPTGGAVGHYLGSMLTSLTSRIFNNAADDLAFIIRTEQDHRGALAAAACAIAEWNSGRDR